MHRHGNDTYNKIHELIKVTYHSNVQPAEAMRKTVTKQVRIMHRWSGVLNRKITLDGDVRESAKEKAGANRGLRLSLEANSTTSLCSALMVPPIETRLIETRGGSASPC